MDQKIGRNWQKNQVMERLQVRFQDEIAETLLITLACRVAESKQKKPILFDQKSLELVDQLDYNLDAFTALHHNVISVCNRAAWIDKVCRDFLIRYPDGILVSIGSGLDTRFFRIDNGQMQFYDLDLPEVVHIRRKLLPESDRNRFLPYSAWDYRWMEEFRYQKDHPILFLAEGVMLYQKEPMVKELTGHLLHNFTHPGNQIVFDLCTNYQISHCGKHPAVNKTKASFNFGTDNPKKLEEWHDWKLLSIYYYARPFFRRLGWRNLLRLIPSIGKGYFVLWFGKINGIK
jgi:O-methyltransferase involved in polyketide biosynthesis